MGRVLHPGEGGREMEVEVEVVKFRKGGCGGTQRGFSELGRGMRGDSDGVYIWRGGRE